MSMSDFVSGGAGCGPSNPLQSLGKRFGHDRSTQQDTYSQGSHQSRQHQFRSNGNANPQQQPQPSFFRQDANGFAAANNAHDAFDVSQLRGNLPSGPQQSLYRQSAGPSMSDMEASFRPVFSGKSEPVASASHAVSSGWATDFMRTDSTQATASPLQSQFSSGQTSRPHNFPNMGSRMNLMYSNHNMSYAQPSVQASAPQLSQGSTASATASRSDQVKWAEAFTAFDASSSSTGTQSLDPAPSIQQNIQPTHNNDPLEQDELARTAGKLVSSVDHDQSTKFKQSNFLDLMRRIRDKQAGIQGTDIVDNADIQTSTLTDAKGKSSQISASQSDYKPTSQQEAYAWANQAASHGNLQNLPAHLQKSMAQRGSAMPSVQSAAQEIENRNAINDLWADEDARSEAIERRAMEESQRSFVGDGGDVAARMQEDDAEAREFAKYQRMGANIPHASTFNRRWEEDMDRGVEADDDENDFVGRRWEGTKGRGLPSAQTAEWDKLQSDWDNFEVTSAGIRPVQSSVDTSSQLESSLLQSGPAYRFLSDNPYIASTRQHAAHSGGIPAGLESVLEKEAAVQQDPQNASAWYDLGVKQQENEREVQAIAALQRALAVDPLYKDAWLALAVSYTNENDRTAAYEAIERWIDMNDKYKDVTNVLAAQLNGQQGRARSDSDSSHSTSSSVLERHGRLSSLLIAMARSGGERGEVDADVQVALGVIFNSSEDYDKAVDCFSTALSVRPSDWLLYNRLGATLSNSGRSAEAIQYYHHALNLQPEFVRCHFNLSISCLNLKMYQDATEHIYTALTLQQAEAETMNMVSTPGDPNRPSSATSGSLWETFRVALELLNRPDLAVKCMSRDINAFDPNDLVAPLAAASLSEPTGYQHHPDNSMSDY